MKQSTDLMSLESSQSAVSRTPKNSLSYLNQDQMAKARQVKEACEMKQAINKQIWVNPQGNLQELFLQYPFCQQIGISASELLQLKGIKLIRGDHRIYFGQVSKTKKQGKGISVYSDGKIYEGCHLNNQKNGLGCEVYTNGNVYIGNFDRNKKHGKGAFYWLNLEQNDVIQYYIGEWWDGLPSGRGRHQRCNGDLYQGEFKNGLKHGEGIEYFINGDVYKGQYINGLPEGYGQYTWKNQSNYKGEFKQGLRYGFGCWKKDNTDNCQSYRGHYLMDLKSGHGIYSWPDGKSYKGEFLNDKKHGFGELYHNEVLKYKGNWQQGKPSQNASQIGETTLNRIRSNSGSISSLKMGNARGGNQSQSTHRVISFKNRAPSRQPTFESTGSGIKQIRLKRPSTGAPVDLKQLSRNTVYGMRGKEPDSREDSYNRHVLKSCHRNCIPVYPWQRRKPVIKQ